MSWKEVAIHWAGVVFLFCIVFSCITNGCSQVEQTNRVKAQLKIEQVKNDSLRIQNGLPVLETPEPTATSTNNQ